MAESLRVLVAVVLMARAPAKVAKAVANQRGFTLIEVLLASVLLFAAISLVTLAYSTAMQSERVVEKRVFKTIVVRFVEQAIAEQLRVRPEISSGSGKWGHFDYNWRIIARRKKFSKAGLDSEAGVYVEWGRKLQLTDIEITLGRDSYVYTHLSWQ